MSEISTFTRAEFEEALVRMAKDNDLENLWGVYNEAPEHLREQILQNMLEMLRRINSQSGVLPDFTSYVWSELDGGPNIAESILMAKEIPKDLFVELAIISASDTVLEANEYLQRKDLTTEDKKRIIESAFYGMKKDSEKGWANTIVKLLEHDLSKKQHDAVCHEIRNALTITPDDEPRHAVSGTVLLHPNTPIEIKKLALEICAEYGGFAQIMQAMEMGDAHDIFEGREEELLSLSVTPIEKEWGWEKIVMILEASKNEDDLPPVVREQIPQILRKALEIFYADSSMLKSEYLEDRLRDEDISPSVRSIVETFLAEEPDEDYYPGKAPEEEKVPDREIALAYISQAKDEKKKGLMEPPKRKATESGKKKGKSKLRK